MTQQILQLSPEGDEFERFLERNGVFEALQSGIEWLQKEGISPDSPEAYHLFLQQFGSTINYPKTELKTLHFEKASLQQKLKELKKRGRELERRVAALDPDEAKKRGIKASNAKSDTSIASSKPALPSDSDASLYNVD